MSTNSKRLSTALAIASFIGIAACSSTEIKTSQDPQANLAQYKTYAWAPEAQPSTEKPNSSILDETVKSSVQQQLAAKGFQQVPTSEAQLLISYTANSANEITYGPAPTYWGWQPAEEPYVTRKGALTIQLVDPHTRRTVWQGTATDTIGNAGESQKQITAAVKDMFEKYPAA